MSEYSAVGTTILNNRTLRPCFRARHPAETLALIARGPRPLDMCRAALNDAQRMLPSGTGVTVWRRTLVLAYCRWLTPAWRVLGHVDKVEASLNLPIVPPTGAAWLRTVDALGAPTEKPQPTEARPATADPMDRWIVWGPGIAHADTYAPLLAQIRPPDMTAEIAAALSAPPASAEACERARLLLQLVLPAGHEPFIWRQRVAACRVAGARPAWRYLGRVESVSPTPRLDVVIVPVGSRWASGCK